MKYLMFLLIGAIALISSCKPDDPVEPDPCSEYPEKMEIVIERLRFANGRLYQDYEESAENQFSRRIHLAFSTNYSYDSIRWQIGNEGNTRVGNKIALNFEDDTEEEVNIRAIGFRQKNQDCFGESDTGIDTIYRKLQFQDWWKSPLFGTYRGTLIGESDSFNVMIVTNPYIRGQFTYYRSDSTYYQGVPKGSTFQNNFAMTWNELFGLNYPNPDKLDTKLTYGRLLPEDRDVLELSYWVKNDPFDLSDITKYTFRGKRIK